MAAPHQFILSESTLERLCGPVVPPRITLSRLQEEAQAFQPTPADDAPNRLVKAIGKVLFVPVWVRRATALLRGHLEIIYLTRDMYGEHFRSMCRDNGVEGDCCEVPRHEPGKVEFTNPCVDFYLRMLDEGADELNSICPEALEMLGIPAHDPWFEDAVASVRTIREGEIKTAIPAAREDLERRQRQIRRLIAHLSATSVAERDEELGRDIEAMEKPKAEERKDAGNPPSGNFPDGQTGQTRDKVGEALGISGRYTKAKSKGTDASRPHIEPEDQLTAQRKEEIAAVAQAALGLSAAPSRRTIFNWIDDGKLRAYKDGEWFFSKEDFDRLARNGFA